ncbi:MAG: hypothetical protein Q8K37_06545, partial [Alphaproteobacteria bacterium]|nr:hypothetical protein [Alphaproteobacteria bacterium]
LEDKMKKILVLCSIFFSTSFLYADDDSKKDELISKILKPDDSQKITNFEILGPLALQLKELSKKFGQNQEKFKTILLDNLNEEALKFSGTDSPEMIGAYKNYFTEEELQFIFNLRKNAIWLKTNNAQYQTYLMNRAMKRMMGSAMSNFMFNFLKQIVAKAIDGGLDKNVSEKMLNFSQKEIDTMDSSEMLKKMRNQYDEQIKQSTLPKASDGVTPEKIALAGEYTSHIYNPDQMVESVMMMVKMVLKKVEDQANTEKGKFSSIINAFFDHEGKQLINQFYIDTFVKASEKAMAEIFTLQELKEMVALQNQPIVQKLNTFSREVLHKIMTKVVMQKTMEGIKNNESFIRIAVNKALEKAKEMNLISGEALSNIQKEVLAMKM